MTHFDDYDPLKSCIKDECDWKHKCDLYRRPRATIYFNPTEYAEFCHHYIRKFALYGNRTDDDSD